MLNVSWKFRSSVSVLYSISLGQECQANGTEFVSVGRRKKKQEKVAGDDDDEYVDLSDDEIVIEDDDDDLSDLYPGNETFFFWMYIRLID